VRSYFLSDQMMVRSDTTQQHIFSFSVLTARVLVRCFLPLTAVVNDDVNNTSKYYFLFKILLSHALPLEYSPRCFDSILARLIITHSQQEYYFLLYVVFCLQSNDGNNKQQTKFDSILYVTFYELKSYN
jgi:hypothetical protein